MKTRTIYFLAYLFLICSVVTSCKKVKEEETQPGQQHTFEVLIYGKPSCSMCTSFKNKCEANGIEYTYYDIENDSEKETEMRQKVYDAGLGNGWSVSLPVVDVIVDGVSHVFEQPDIQDVLDLKP